MILAYQDWLILLLILDFFQHFKIILVEFAQVNHLKVWYHFLVVLVHKLTESSVRYDWHKKQIEVLQRHASTVFVIDVKQPAKVEMARAGPILEHYHRN